MSVVGFSMVTNKVPQLKFNECSFEMLVKKLSMLASKMLNETAGSREGRYKLASEMLWVESKPRRLISV